MPNITLAPDIGARQPMKSKMLSENEGVRTFVVVLDPGDEAFKSISDFAATESITAAAVTAIGAFERAMVDGSTLSRRHIERFLSTGSVKS
jgi:predicted DNA-binding protein with PD1-like motif